MKKKKKNNLPLLILCLLLAVSLLVSVLFLASAKKDVKLLEAELLKLSEEKDSLENLNQALRLQLDSYFLTGTPGTYVEEDYCSLLVDSWSEKDGVLSVDTLAQVFLTQDVSFTAKLELWRGESVYASQEVTLNETEANTIYEADLSATFEIPAISAGEELQLCLMIEPEAGEPFFAYAAAWYLENGELAIVTG